MDVSHMDFDDESFDLVLDKGLAPLLGRGLRGPTHSLDSLDHRRNLGRRVLRSAVLRVRP